MLPLRLHYNALAIAHAARCSQVMPTSRLQRGSAPRPQPALQRWYNRADHDAMRRRLRSQTETEWRWSSPAVVTIGANYVAHAMSSELDLLITAEIAEGRPMSFSRFMERALTEPSLGYYVTEQIRAGREGDFITAPELHSLLSSALARMATEVWRRVGETARFRWVEYGAGSGALALALVAQLRRDGSPLINALEIQPIDVNRFRSEELRNAVTNQQQNGAPSLVGADAPPVAGMVVANEYLDALPFNIYVGRAPQRTEFQSGALGSPQTA